MKLVTQEKKKKCQDEKATGNGKAGHNAQLLHVVM